MITTTPETAKVHWARQIVAGLFLILSVGAWIAAAVATSIVMVPVAVLCVLVAAFAEWGPL